MPIKELTTVDIREQIALKALDDRYTLSEVARMYGVSRVTARLWRDRYRSEGRAGLSDRSHAPHSRPGRTSDQIEQLILAERREFGWGSKKILQRLEDEHPELQLPRRSTVDEVLKRHGMTAKRRRPAASRQTPFRRRYEATEPSELTTIDHKGEFRLLNGKYCYPLTMMDSVSRFILAFEALESTRFNESWPVVERVLREHGLPIAMQSDNGPPFGSPGRFSQFTVELMILGILPVFGRPGRPQDNARHERMHREAKREATRPPAGSKRAQQKIFNRFSQRYNVDRPHEGIDMQRPAQLYRSSPRPFPTRRAKPDYPLHCDKRRVSAGGYIKWENERVFIGEALGGHTVAIERTADALCSVYFYNFAIGKLDEITKEFI